MTEHYRTSSPRIEAIDALRGFAVVAIFLVHNVEHFIYPVYPEDQPAWLAVLDSATFDVVFSLFAGKAYAIFALLFGFTFYLQYSRRAAKGEDFGYRFLWRLLLLGGFATLNAAFFPAGDVLLLFSIVGIVLFFARKLSDRALLIAAVFFLLQPVEWLHYIWSCIDSCHRLPDLGVDDMYNEVAEYTKAANIGNFLLCNITLGQKASLLWAVGAGRFLQTAGLFLLGLYIGRRGLFVNTEAHRRAWVMILIAAAVSFAPLYSLKCLAMDADSELVQRTVGTALDMWQKLAFTFVLIASFVLLYGSGRFRKYVGGLRYYGRMSLTNYISQSVIGSLVYFPFALGLAPYCGCFASLLLGIVLACLQILFCRRWLKSHRQGPLESLWHRLTWIRISR